MVRHKDHPYERATKELAGSAFGAVRYVEETGSTNADAAALLGDARSAGLSIVANRQTHGSGRKGRAWKAPPGASLLVTTILPNELEARQLWAVPFWVALAVRATLAAHDVATTLHWPNDLLVGPRKLAGILCVSRVTGGAAYAACGVGINLHRYTNADDEIDPPAAFCDDAIPSVDRAELLIALLREYDARLDALRSPLDVAQAWEEAAGFPGVTYRILKDGEAAAFDATALRVADGGGLVVEHHDDSREETISLADARVLR
jgi:BirA family biotin operon repressor/biotin-[acetyl-CoA-carboxylase] ligase